MSVTQIKSGVYRHSATGFVVHEVYHLADVLEANGVLVESGTSWMWLAGRDLRDLVAYYQPGNLASLAAIIARPKFANKRIGLPGAIIDIRPTFFMSNSWSSVTSQPTRLFALVNNLDAGCGCSSVLSNGQQYAWSMGATAYFGGEPGTGFYGNYGEPRPDAVGTGLVPVPTGYTWASLFDTFAQAMPESGKSEVQQKLAAGRVLYYKWLAARGQKPTDKIYHRIPLALRKAASPLYIPPVIDQLGQNISGGLSQMNMIRGKDVPGTAPGTLRAPRFLGARAWNDLGLGMMMPPLLTAASTLGVLNGVQNPSVWNSTTLPVLDEFTGLQAVASIDNVPLSKVLGGASALALSDTGVYTPSSGAGNLSSAQSLRSYLDLSSPGPTTLPTRAVDPATGALETDQVMGARLEAAYAGAKRTPNASAVTTQYETHGLTLFGGIMVAAASVNAEKQWLLDHHRWDMYGAPKLPMTINPTIGTLASIVADDDSNGLLRDWPEAWQKMWPD